MEKKIYLGALAVLALGMTACTSEEPIGGGETATKTGEKYVAVQIHNVGTNGGTRAEGDDDDVDPGMGADDLSNYFDGYEEGIGNENTITAANTRFYFYDAEGKPFPLASATVNGTVQKTNMVTPLALKQENVSTGIGASHEEGATLNAVLVLGLNKDDGYLGATTPSIMVCAVNLTDESFDALAGTTLSDLQKEISNISDGVVNTTKFAMTSATYLDENGKEIYWTDIADCVKDTYDEAMAAPAHAYIERLAAKVRVNGLTKYMSTTDGQEVAEYNFYNPETGGVVKKKLAVTLTGWQLRNTYGSVRLIKDLEGTTDNPLPLNFSFNDAANHRSYWAVTGVDAGQLKETSFNIYDPTQFTLGNYPTAEGTSSAAQMAACRYIYPSTGWWNQPNTINTLSNGSAVSGPEECGKALSNRVTNTTAVVVKAVINQVDAEGNVIADAENDIVYWGGTYYLLSDFKEFVANAYNDEKKLTGENRVTAAAVTLGGTVDGETTEKDNKRSVKVNGTNYLTMGRVSFWEKGQSSFYVNIQHATSSTAQRIFGIVRNHIYDMNLTAVVGLGVPGNDIENPKDEKETYLAAHIDVLNWHVVKNNIVLE